MLVADFTHLFVGNLSAPVRCRTRVYRPPDGRVVVIVSELPKQVSRIGVISTTEQLATAIRERFVASSEELVWIDYDPDPPKAFERVLFRWDDPDYDAPVWQPSSRAEVEALIGETLGAEEAI